VVILRSQKRSANKEFKKHCPRSWSLNCHSPVIWKVGSKVKREAAADYRCWYKQESEYFLQEQTYLRVFLSVLLAESQRLHCPPTAQSEMDTKCFNFTARPHCCQCTVHGGYEVGINNCWTNIPTKFSSLCYCTTYI